MFDNPVTIAISYNQDDEFHRKNEMWMQSHDDWSINQHLKEYQEEHKYSDI